MTDYLDQLDMAAVAEAILKTESGRPMTAEDFEDAKRMLWEAAETWLVQDIFDLQIDGVEIPYESVFNFRGNNQRVKAFIDVLGTVRGRLNNTRKYEGKRVIIDWKTTSNLTLDSKWKERYIESWQGRIYDLLEPVDVVLFRGLSRGGKFADIVLEFDPAESRPAALNQIEGVSLMRKSLIDAGLSVWPMNKPHACGAYGRECPYKETCPGEPMSVFPSDKSFSYSSMNTFLLCPERHRRTVLEQLEEGHKNVDGSEESDFGNAVHRGLAELYRQVKEKNW